MIIFPMSCSNPNVAMSSTLCCDKSNALAIFTARSLTLWECLSSRELFSKRVLIIVLMVNPRTPWLSLTFLLYIYSSALLNTCSSSRFSSALVSQPKAMDKISLSVFKSLASFVIRCTISSASSEVVLGKMRANSSPPQRETIPFPETCEVSRLAANLSNLSPS
ncbi:hypothetical protein SDC9_165981 [bioreactor metagenome]|uniref:Uncharacterized protein n=1 Tax=bioreactor metagenome TaxID=1076179 RepID=A0A645FYB0_9ZZZZ